VTKCGCGSMIDEQTVRQYYIRLNHTLYGLTELVAIKHAGGIGATGFFDNENAFVAACRFYNRSCNVYAGRNPRPFGFGKKNTMSSARKRAKDKDISYITAMSLDIDPIRKKDTPSTNEQHEKAIEFALKLQKSLGGDVDSSGNGAYVWIPFGNPIDVNDELKHQCEEWQAQIKKLYRPEEYGLRIDGCYDFSRIKRVIGTYNHKAGRQSGFVKRTELSDKVRDEILSIEIRKTKQPKSGYHNLAPSKSIPTRFQHLLEWDSTVRDLWQNPDPDNDTSRHDWIIGLVCVEAGITNTDDLAAILMNNPHGKYRRDEKLSYVGGTVKKLLLR